MIETEDKRVTDSRIVLSGGGVAEVCKVAAEVCITLGLSSCS